MDDQPWAFSLGEARANLPDDPEVFRFWYGLRHGTMKVGLYAPRERDTQGPHKQDELYIVASGTGTFVKAGQTRPFAVGDVLFVEAGVEHRFETFSDDFALGWCSGDHRAERLGHQLQPR